MSQTTAQQKSAGAQQCGTNQNSSVTGDLRLHEFRSRVFHNVRLLRVWLPPCYDDPGNERGYPVLYLNDGQNLFDRTTAHTGIEWQADETADRLIREQKIPPMIIVGIDNAQKDRLKEYLPYRSFSPPVLVAGSDALCPKELPYRQSAGAHGVGRFIFGSEHFALHRYGRARLFWPLASGEPIIVHFEPSIA